MRFFDAGSDLVWLFRRLVESGRLDQQVKINPPGREEEIEYLGALTGDNTRYAELKEHLPRCDFAKEMNKGIERAFVEHLHTVRESELSITDDDFTAYMEWLKQHIRTFMFKIEALEKEKGN